MMFIIRFLLVFKLVILPLELGEEDINPDTKIESNKQNKNKQNYGTATWYGRYFHGRKTANGEIYNMHGNSCATGNRNIPFGSKLKITNIKNDKSIIVTVNDRMNKRYHPVDYKGDNRIDLSVGAFKQLAPIKQGVIKIKFEIIYENN